MHDINAHGPEANRRYRLTRRLADARERATAARDQGDTYGAQYATAEYRRLARILAEG
jgi:hypothetical protein